jgi:hypothetical protein
MLCFIFSDGVCYSTQYLTFFFSKIFQIAFALFSNSVFIVIHIYGLFNALSQNLAIFVAVNLDILLLDR